nr:MAG TPA: hypothetical protein [Caudoviricetes sp.]
MDQEPFGYYDRPDYELGSIGGMNGVSFYLVGIDERKVFFQNGKVCCRECPYCKSKTVNGHLRILCIRTYEPLMELDKLGADCPLSFTGEIVGKKEQKWESP